MTDLTHSSERISGHRRRPVFVLAALLAGLFASLVIPFAAPALASGDFGLIDHRGDFHQISRYADSKAVILMAWQADDQASLDAAAGLQDLRDQLADDAFVFLLLNASDSRAVVIEQTSSHALDLPVLLDGSQTVAKTLDVSTLGEVLILNPASQRLIYRGPVNRIAQALSQWSSTQRIEPAVEPVTGTALHYHYLEQLSGQTISYQDDIAPLLQARCAYCHVDNGLAPWPMNRHIMVLGWSPMIRETVITRRMPPGQIDPDVGEWTRSHHLSDQEMALLIEWIDRGAPRDGDHDPLTDALPVHEEWPLGPPDMIVDIPEEHLPATGIVDFRLKRLALDLPEDRWLRAISYSVGDPSVLHSLLVYTLDRDANIAADDQLISADHAEYVSVYVPGDSDDVFPADTAFRLGANKDLVVKLRYLTSGRETVDRTRIGLYFQDETPAMALRSMMLDRSDIVIPPNSRDHVEVLLTSPSVTDYYLESYSPHAHNRGKRMRLTAIYPDGQEELLINVANYNFNWQLAYTLRERKLIPSGTRLRAETIYDNSAANPFNPDPDIALQASPSTWDEMFSHLLRIIEAHRSE